MHRVRNVKLLAPQTRIQNFARLEDKVKSHLTGRLAGLKLESMSVVDGKVNLQYQYRKRSTFDWTAFTNELGAAAAPARLDIFIG